MTTPQHENLCSRFQAFLERAQEIGNLDPKLRLSGLLPGDDCSVAFQEVENGAVKLGLRLALSDYRFSVPIDRGLQEDLNENLTALGEDAGLEVSVTERLINITFPGEVISNSDREAMAMLVVGIRTIDSHLRNFREGQSRFYPSEVLSGNSAIEEVLAMRLTRPMLDTWAEMLGDKKLVFEGESPHYVIVNIPFEGELKESRFQREDVERRTEELIVQTLRSAGALNLAGASFSAKLQELDTSGTKFYWRIEFPLPESEKDRGYVVGHMARAISENIAWMRSDNPIACSR